MSSSTTLTIKSPNQQVDDLTVECSLLWTVEQLKDHLSVTYPSHPKPEDQKLIYSGILLQDHLCLQDVLRQYSDETTHTVHLVCSNTCSPMGEGLRCRTRNTEVVEPSVTFSTEDTSQMSPQQLLWMQHMYSHYMVQYMQYSQFAGLPSSFVHPQLPDPLTIPASSQPAQPQHIPEPNDVIPDRQPPNQNIRMNAQGGQVLDDEDDVDINRDWLDWLYVGSRLLILMSIVYFYSNVSRLLLVISCVVGIFFFQRVFRSPQPRAPQNVPLMPENNEVDVQHQEEEDPAVDQSDAATPDVTRDESDASEDGDGSLPAVVVPRRSILTFLYTFISSLLPEPIAELNN